MQLERIILINLDRRWDKMCTWLGAASVACIPMEKIKKFSAIDGKDFRMAEDIITLAEPDYPHWKELRNQKWIKESGRLGSLAMMLSFQMVLKKISEWYNPESLFIFCLDHYCPCIQWSVMEERVKVLPPFDVFQMIRFGDPLEPRESDYPVPLDADSTLSYGLGGGGDCCLMLTPQGAKMVLEWWAEYPRFFLEKVIDMKSSRPLSEQPGCISVIEPANFKLLNYKGWVSGPLKLLDYGIGPESERGAIDAEDFWRLNQ